MKRHHLIFLSLLTILAFSCQENPQKTPSSQQLEPKINLAELKTDFRSWWSYHTNNISLASNFIGLDTQSDTIEKEQFLEQLATSNYVPLRLASPEGIETYKLYILDSSTDISIGKTIRNESLTSLKHHKMEGSPLSEFSFTDLDGQIYTNENTRGKTVILKTWFVNCVACIAEFPELNEWVETYKERKDIIFLSLATDAKPKLENFLQKRRFEYKVSPDQGDFINKLDLRIYPTHIMVDKNGIILKVVNKASEMISFFEKEERLAAQ